jgi:hypothetical protein
MAVTTDPFVAGDLAAIIPEVWQPMVLKQLFAKTVFTNFFTDFSSYASAGGDTIHIPDMFTNNFSVSTQSTQGAEVTTAGPAQNDVTLAINTHSYIAHIVGDKDKAQIASNLYDFSALYGEKTGGALANDLDAAIAALWSGLSTNSVGDTATSLVDTEIRGAIEKLASANFDLRECAWFVHPYVFWIQLAGIAKYYDNSQSTFRTVADGNFGPMDASRSLAGQLYGIPVYTSTNVVSGLSTYRNLLAHKTAFGFAVQTPGANKVRVQAENAIRNLGLLTVSDIVYGVAELRDAAAVVVNANTSFLGS